MHTRMIFFFWLLMSCASGVLPATLKVIQVIIDLLTMDILGLCAVHSNGRDSRMCVNRASPDSTSIYCKKRYVLRYV